MKRIFIIMCWLLPMFINAQENSTIKFSNANNWIELLTEAQKLNKPIFIDAYTSWCGPCKKMDLEVFTNKTVADYLNQNFVSIRVQIDSTKDDNALLRAWRKDAKKWHDYITAYPCFLFFTPDGQFAGRELGFYNSREFTALLKKAIDPNESYLARLKKFKKGELSRKQLIDLAFYAQRVKDTIANAIARTYKNKYLNGLPVDSLLNPEANKFISEFFLTFNSNDSVIKFMNQYPSVADSLFQRKNDYSMKVSDMLISRDYIYRYILPNDIPIITVPEWDKIRNKISSAFGNTTAKRVVLDAKLFWAYRHEQFENVARLEFEKIDNYGLDTTEMGRIFFNNMIYNVVFKNVNDTSLLRKASKLMKHVTDLDRNRNSNLLDTYASILYKGGKRSKALEAEKLALSVAKDQNNQQNIQFYSDMINRMKEGEKIWEKEN